MSELENAPLLVDVTETARLLNVGRTTVYKLIRRGELTSVRLGGSRKVPAAAIRAYVARLQQKAAMQDLAAAFTERPDLAAAFIARHPNVTIDVQAADNA